MRPKRLDAELHKNAPHTYTFHIRSRQQQQNRAHGGKPGKYAYTRIEPTKIKNKNGMRRIEQRRVVSKCKLSGI